jgi:hypothetical protein
MYRCYSCDTPSQHGHMMGCIVEEQQAPVAAQPQQQERRINIASGDDAVWELEESVAHA